MIRIPDFLPYLREAYLEAKQHPNDLYQTEQGLSMKGYQIYQLVDFCQEISCTSVATGQ